MHLQLFRLNFFQKINGGIVKYFWLMPLFFLCSFCFLYTVTTSTLGACQYSIWAWGIVLGPQKTHFLLPLPLCFRSVWRVSEGRRCAGRYQQGAPSVLRTDIELTGSGNVCSLMSQHRLYTPPTGGGTTVLKCSLQTIVSCSAESSHSFKQFHQCRSSCFQYIWGVTAPNTHTALLHEPSTHGPEKVTFEKSYHF